MLSFRNRLIVIVAIISNIADASRILGVFPHPVLSIQMTIRSLTLELAQRGHELIVFTPNPTNDPSLLPQYTEIDLHYLYDLGAKTVIQYNNIKREIWFFLDKWYKINENITDEILSHPTMQQLIAPNSTAKFDLIIVQSLFYDAFYALSFRFNAPLVAISTLPLFSIHDYNMGNVPIRSTSPDMSTGYDENMNLWQRFVNMYYQLRMLYEYNYIILPIQEKVSRKHFGNNVPPAHELASRISLMLANSHPYFVYPRSNVPAIIHIGGFHVQTKKKKKLPQDLEKILNNAKEGYIYFSLGTSIKSHNLPIDRYNMFVKAFATLPYKVLWKFETDHLKNKPDNVVFRSWFPQQEVLAHPNIRLFIYHGGLHSTDEAIENVVPVIGFPVSIDQVNNMKRMQQFGVGKILSIDGTNTEELRKTILEVITNSSYKENILKMRDLFRDVPQKPMDKAIWWIEHVIRHKGAAHLRNKSRDTPWYQEQMLDLMAIALGITALVICIIITIICYIFKKCLLVRKNIDRDSKKEK